MSKYSIKRYCISILLVCSMILCIPVMGSNQVPIDEVINSSYKSLENIQKQFQSILKTAYVNEPNTASTGEYIKELNVFLKQINQIIEELTSWKDTPNISSEQDTQLQALLAISHYLTYIHNKTYKFLISQDRSEKFNLLNDIFVTNAFIDQVANYGFNN